MNTLNNKLSEVMEDVFKYFEVDGVELILNMMLNQMMKIERDAFLEESRSKGIYNKGNGYYERFIKTLQGHFKVMVPRDRNGIFKPVMLEIIKNEEEQRLDLFHELYLQGLSTRSISTVIGKIYNTHLSPTTISNITKRYRDSLEEWLKRPLEEEYYFLYVDTLRVNVRRDIVSKENFYIVLGLRPDLHREIVGVYTLPEESASGWREVLQDLKKRGLKRVLGLISDEFSGLADVISEEFPESTHQICLVHKLRNMQIIMRRRDYREFKSDWDRVFIRGGEIYNEEAGDIETLGRRYGIKEALQNLESLIMKWEIKYPRIRRAFEINPKELYLNYLKYPVEIQRMIYTTNWIENQNSIIRKTVKQRRSFPNITSAMDLIGGYLLRYEEEKLLRYKVTSFISSQAILEIMLAKQRRKLTDESRQE